jgi:hypothetical protein
MHNAAERSFWTLPDHHDRPAIDDPRAANGKCIANFSGPNAGEFQFWRAGGRIVLAQFSPTVPMR